MDRTIEFNGETLDTELTADQQYAIIKSYYASPHYNTDQKKALKGLLKDG